MKGTKLSRRLAKLDRVSARYVCLAHIRISQSQLLVLRYRGMCISALVLSDFFLPPTFALTHGCQIWKQHVLRREFLEYKLETMQEVEDLQGMSVKMHKVLSHIKHIEVKLEDIAQHLWSKEDVLSKEQVLDLARYVLFTGRASNR